MLQGPATRTCTKSRKSPISLDQQLREAQMKKETKPVSLDQQLRRLK